MIKTILPSAFDFGDSLVSLVDVHSQGVDRSWMSKRAAAGIFKDADIKPEKDHSFIHLIAMGDAEFYGANRNGDYFYKSGRAVEVPHPKKGVSKILNIEKGNKETHKTFETNAKVYRNHQNKDPQKAHGDVVKSAHNEPMSRVELMIKVPNATWQDELEKLASGGDVPFSMSCKIPYDYCSECGNRARTRREYCSDLKDHMGEITKEGNHIGAINDGMVYFDISKVVVPADRIAFGLLKAASDTTRTVGGAELAESLDMFTPEEHADDLIIGSRHLNKLAMIRKLSEIEKEIESHADGKSPLNQCSMAFDPEVQPDLDDDDVSKLQVPRDQVSDVLGSMADVKISLSLKDFLRMIMGSKFGDVEAQVPQAESMLPGIFGRMTKLPASSVSGFDDFNLSDGVIPRRVREVIGKNVPGQSLDDEPVSRRMTIMILRGKSPLKLKSVEQEKSGGATSVLAERLAMAYAMYKVAFCQYIGDNDRVTAERAVLQHYV